MPWKGLRSNTAGGRTSRRHSVIGNRDLPVPNGDAEGHSVESIAGPVDTTPEKEATSHQSSDKPSPDAPPPAAETNRVGDEDEGLHEQLRHGDTAQIPKNHRFSLLKFRHASDPQLSRSYASSAPSLTPPLPKPTSKCSMRCK